MKDVTELPWREVRIFTKNFNVVWYPTLLGNFAIEFAKAFPESPFWFTRYVVPENNGDKPIIDLPDDYWVEIDGTWCHASLRFRFACAGLENDFVRDFLKRNENTYLHDPIIEYSVLSFAEDRIYSGSDWASRARRAKLMG